MAGVFQDDEDYMNTMHGNYNDHSDNTPTFDETGIPITSNDLVNISCPALQNMAISTSTQKLGSVKLHFEMKGKLVANEFFRRPLGFDIIAEKKTKMFGCSSGCSTGRYVVSKVTDPKLKLILKKGMAIYRINDIVIPKDIEDYEFLEMFYLALTVLPEITDEELKIAEQASAECQMEV
eukprot:TRINITY_DN49392_c0_g1_i1.p1 TRINITY_DN49392_c0_g1~~TRINITY_DN49392_c0_g1_i1.p1  ORF type:complete len:179 (+),score=41.64 TRINITY_DN49392_c0_g1_i1:87-623(+)